MFYLYPRRLLSGERGGTTAAIRPNQDIEFQPLIHDSFVAVCKLESSSFVSRDVSQIKNTVFDNL
jgi:hypothetical protein